MGDEFSANLGTRRAFRWPSIARLGPEAERLAGRVFGNEGDMGLSSPKRYIWDTQPSINTWFLNPHGRSRLAGEMRKETQPANKGDFASQLRKFATESLLELSQFLADDGPDEPHVPGNDQGQDC